MPLSDMQIRRAKPEDKPYTLGDGQGLSLNIEPNGSKSWRFRYRCAGKPKMISQLLMITDVRTIELGAALWQEFDLDNAIWEIPAERMKMRKAYLVPLSTQALDLLNEIKVMTGSYRYVFPGRNDPNKPMSETSINQLIKRIGYAGRVTGHGFRHTLSTILHEKGYASAWIETQLAHTDKNKIRGTYNHAQYVDDRRDMMDWYSSFILKY